MTRAEAKKILAKRRKECCKHWFAMLTWCGCSKTCDTHMQPIREEAMRLMKRG